VDAYPNLAEEAMGALFQFDTAYLSEPGFLVLVAIEKRNQNQVAVKDNMHIAMSRTGPQLKLLIQTNKCRFLMEIYF
jgi:hypothetical protein